MPHIILFQKTKKAIDDVTNVVWVGCRVGMSMCDGELCNLGSQVFNFVRIKFSISGFKCSISGSKCSILKKQVFNVSEQVFIFCFKHGMRLAWRVS